MSLPLRATSGRRRSATQRGSALLEDAATQAPVSISITEASEVVLIPVREPPRFRAPVAAVRHVRRGADGVAGSTMSEPSGQ